MNKIYLVGLPGSGKTKLGRILSSKLKYKFIDMDLAIERQEKMTVKDIIETRGIKAFRNLETKLLISIGSFNNLVVSTGGGIVETIQNKSLLKGEVIYLKTDPKNIHFIKEEKIKRPLLKDFTLKELYDKRHKLYEDVATIIVDCNNKSDQQIVKEILENENIGN